MTYKQIEQIEQYIKEAEWLKNSTLPEKDLYLSAKNLDDKAKASAINYKADINWNKCYLAAYNSGHYNKTDLLLNVDIILAALQGILDSILYYSYILEVRKDIAKGKKIKDGDAKKRFVTEIAIKYQGKMDFGKNVQEFIKQNDMFLINFNANAICDGVIQKLNLYLNEICEEKKEIKKQSLSKQPIIQVNQNQSVNQNQETKVSVSLSFEDCFKALDDCETLNEIETQEIKAQLQEIQELLKDKKGKKKSIKSKIGSVLKWIAEKGTDVMVAVLPMLLQSLQGL